MLGNVSVMTNSHKQSRSRSGPVEISSIIGSVVSTIGIRSTYEGERVVDAWPEIVGADIAQRAIADRVVDGVLMVCVEKDVWRQQLQMQREEILRKIHRLPFGRSIKDIRLVGGKKGLDPDGIRND